MHGHDAAVEVLGTSGGRGRGGARECVGGGALKDGLSGRSTESAWSRGMRDLSIFDGITDFILPVLTFSI